MFMRINVNQDGDTMRTEAAGCLETAREAGGGETERGMGSVSEI